MKNVEDTVGLHRLNSRNSLLTTCNLKRENVVRRGEVLLRFGMVVLALVSAVVLGTASERETIMGIEKTANFHLLKSLVFLVITDGVLAGYSLLQGVRCVSCKYMGRFLLSKKLAWMIFSFDQVMAYVSIGVVASATEAAFLALKGNTELQWTGLCLLFKKFCWQMGSGIVIGFIAAVAMVVVSAISAYNLFKLYGNKS